MPAQLCLVAHIVNGGEEVSNENELYERWKECPEVLQEQWESELFHAVERHARAVVWLRLGEQNRELVHEIASAAILGLPTFQQQSQFGTWVHSIAQNHVNTELRRRGRYRQVFAEHEELTDEVHPRTENNVDLYIMVHELEASLSPQKRDLLKGMGEEKDHRELARELNISIEAVESRIRRLRSFGRKFRSAMTVKH